MSSNLPGVLEVHTAACLILTKMEILIEKIDVQETGLGLMAPANKWMLNKVIRNIIWMI